MRLSIAMGLVCLGLTLVLLATFLIEERPSIQSTDAGGNPETVYLGHGRAHPDVDTLLAGGSGADRGEHVWWLAAAYGALQLAFFVCCMLLGVRRGGTIGPAGKLIAGGSVLYFLAFAGLMLSYRDYMAADSLSTVGSLPEPTAWMLYVLTPAPLLFLVVFVLGFRRFVWDDESERTLREIVAEKRAAEENG